MSKKLLSGSKNRKDWPKSRKRLLVRGTMIVIERNLMAEKVAQVAQEDEKEETDETEMMKEKEVDSLEAKMAKVVAAKTVIRGTLKQKVEKESMESMLAIATVWRI